MRCTLVLSVLLLPACPSSPPRGNHNQGGAADVRVGSPDGDGGAGASGGSDGRGSYQVIDVTKPGIIEGAVSGAPESKGTACGAPLVVPTVVWIDAIKRGMAPDDRAVSDLSLRRCAFAPHVLLLPHPDAELAVRNDEPERHEPVVTSDQGEELARMPMPLEGQRFTLRVPPGFYRVTCHLHPDELAWVVVPAHPYYTLANDDGNFELDGVPPARHHIRAWHPPAAKDGAALTGAGDVTVPESGEALLNLELR